ncbi:MAG: branched-chain amino acid ABC transporter permease [Eubacteriales bacterium]|nr:branched-chain amino acid ABC transporter permease [Eubacteriales bacterium]
MSVSYLTNQILNGIVLGFSYALVGAGLSLLWGTLKMINLAHGDLYMMGAYFAWLAIRVGKIPIIPGIIIGVICAAALCLFIQISTVRPLVRQGDFGMSPYILTMGLSILLQNTALLVYGERYQNIPYYLDKVYKFFNGSVTISGQRLLIIVVSLVVILFLMIIIKRTKLGRAIRATAQDREFASMLGVNTKSVYTVTYVISGSLAAIAGIMLAPIYSVNPWMGTAVQTKGLACCVLGGLGSVEGAIVGGLIIGIAESLSVTFLSKEWKDVVAYLILIVMLWVKPSGIFGKRGAV